MEKRDVLKEEKRLKAVRRRNVIVKNHNFVIKTLSKPIPTFDSMTQAVKDAIYKVMAINRMRKIERNK